MPFSSSVSFISGDCFSLDFFAPRGDEAVLSTSLSNKLYKTYPVHFYILPLPYSTENEVSQENGITNYHSIRVRENTFR